MFTKTSVGLKITWSGEEDSLSLNSREMVTDGLKMSWPFCRQAGGASSRGNQGFESSIRLRHEWVIREMAPNEERMLGGL
jgi:hypothetical protein